MYVFVWKCTSETGTFRCRCTRAYGSVKQCMHTCTYIYISLHMHIHACLCISLIVCLLAILHVCMHASYVYWFSARGCFSASPRWHKSELRVGMWRFWGVLRFRGSLAGQKDTRNHLYIILTRDNIGFRKGTHIALNDKGDCLTQFLEGSGDWGRSPKRNSEARLTIYLIYLLTFWLSSCDSQTNKTHL